MQYEEVIAFQRLEQKLDDIGMMVAELVKAKRAKEKLKRLEEDDEEELTEDEKNELEIITTKKKKRTKTMKAENEAYPEYN